MLQKYIKKMVLIKVKLKNLFILNLCCVNTTGIIKLFEVYIGCNNDIYKQIS